MLHRRDRLENIEYQLVNQQIKACIWPGILNSENPKTGIASAHKQIVLYAKDHNLPYVIIAEDDIKFTSKGAFDYFLANEPSDYDLYLGGIYHGDIKKDNSVMDFSGLTLYKIKHTFYEKFLSITENLDLDRALAQKGKFFVCDPFVAFQSNGYSDNKKKFCNYDLLIKNRNLFGYKK